MVGSLAGARVLDLYAGSGAVGLEALSRGAGHVLLVEAGARAGRVIRENIAAIGLPGAQVITDRVERVLARGPAADGGRYDIVFADPPYALADREVSAMLSLLAGGDAPAIPRGDSIPPNPPGSSLARGARAPRPPWLLREGMAERSWLAPGALVIVERATRSGPVRWPEGFVADRARRYGEATFWYGLRPGTP